MYIVYVLCFRTYTWVAIWLLVSLVVLTKLPADERPDGKSTSPWTSKKAADAKPAAPIQLADDYLAQGRGKEYVAWAENFLERNANSALAPRVALDLYMVGVKLDDDTLQQEAMRKLVFDYTDSPATLAMLKLSAQDAAGFRMFVSAQFEKSYASAEFPKSFIAAATAGAQGFGTSFLDDNDLVLSLGLAALVTGDTRLLEYCRQRLATADEPLPQIATVALDPKPPGIQKISLLQAHKDRAAARKCHKFFVARLSEAERSTPEMLLLEAERLLSAGEWKDALPIVAKLAAARPEPRYLFWRALCLTAAGQHDLALPILRQLAAQHSQQPLGIACRQLLPAIETFDKNLDEHARVAHQQIQQLFKDDVAVVEALAYIVADDKVPYECYLGIDPAQNESLQLLAWRNKQVLFAAATGKTARIFLAGEEKIHEFQKYVLFKPALDIARDPDGKFNLKFAGNITSELAALADVRKELLRSPFVGTEKGLRQLMVHECGKGNFPCPSYKENGRTILPWLIVDPMTCHVDVLKVALSEGCISVQHLLEGGQCHLQAGLRYGQSGAFRLSPPAWPDLPVESHAEFDVAALLRLYGCLEKAIR